MIAKMIAWPVALNRSSNGFSPGECTHCLHLFSTQPCSSHGLKWTNWTSRQNLMQHMRARLVWSKHIFLALRRQMETSFSLLSFPFSSHRSIVCFWPLTVWSVLISHGPNSFDQNLKSVPQQTPFPFPDYPQPSWLQTDAVSENLRIKRVQLNRVLCRQRA